MFEHLRCKYIDVALSSMEISDADIDALYQGALIHPRYVVPLPRTAWQNRAARLGYYALGAGTLCRVRTQVGTDRKAFILERVLVGFLDIRDGVRWSNDLRTPVDAVDVDELLHAAVRHLQRSHPTARTVSGLPLEIALIEDLDAQRAAAEAFRCSRI